MSHSPDRLYELLPVIHRLRDAEQGYPLRALLRVVNEQVDLVENDVAQLYDNWFIETCDDWVVPYLGDLIGYRPVHEAGEPGPVDSAQGRARNRVLVPRREVAETLGFRRRKGTLALLELLTRDAAGWPARVVEFYRLLGWTQYLKFLRLRRGRTVDLRDGEALDLLDGPFERLAHTVDVRRVISERSPGRHDVPSIGVFVWRLASYPITQGPACPLEGLGAPCYTFSALGHDTPLYAKAQPETEPTAIADEINLPTPIRRRGLEERVSLRPLRTRVSDRYYGETKSFTLYAPDWPTRNASQPVPRELIVPADLSNWRYRAPRGHVAMDPVLGRLVFPANHAPRNGVWVSYHYGFSTDMGGGQYRRVLTQPVEHTLYRVKKRRPWDTEAPSPDTVASIGEALRRWRDDQKALGPEPDDQAQKEAQRPARERLRAAVIEIGDSGAYTEPLAVTLDTGESLQIRAASGARPLLRLLDYSAEKFDSFSVTGRQGSRFTLDGLVVTGRGIHVEGSDRDDPAALAAGDLCDVTIRHCTLVPGWGLECDCEPTWPNEASLELVNTSARIVIEHSILGSIFVTADEVQTDPVEVSISDSIVDATSLERTAVGAPDLPLAFARLTLRRTTVIGEVNTHAIELADNAIFMGPVRVGRRQVGCVRFSYVTPVSRTPRRYHGQPDLVIAALDERQPTLTDDDKARWSERETDRVRPRFTSLRYGTPGYGQLADDCAEEIRRGADDESEMGAFHDLFQPQRTANLRARLDEYTAAGMGAGILFAS